jgi:hypothetical protein
MNYLELEFLELIQFELYIDTKVYIRFYEELRNPVLHPNCTCMYTKSQWRASREERREAAKASGERRYMRTAVTVACTMTHTIAADVHSH